MKFWSNPGAFAVWTLDAIFRIAEPSDPQFHADGTKYAIVWQGDVYIGDVSGGAPQKVAPGGMPRWISGGRLAYRTRAGQVAIAPDKTVTTSATPVSSYAFDGDTVYFLAMEKSAPQDPIVSGARQPHAWLFRQKAGAADAQPVSPKDWHIVSFTLSPDGTRAACSVQRSPLNRDVFHVDIHEIDLGSGKPSPLVVQPGRDADPSYSPDGKTVAFHSQVGSENYFEARHVAVVPSGGGKIRYLTERAEWDVFRGGNRFAWSSDSRFITFTAGLRTDDVVVRHPVNGDPGQQILVGISGSAAITGDGARILYLKTGPSHPMKLTLRENSAERTLWDPNAFIADLPKMQSRVLEWRSRDGTPIDGILWLPPSYRPGERVPLLVELHGGPTGVALNRFPIPRTYPFQLFLDKGFAIFQPNFRGSVNRGAPFRLLNAQSQGEGDFDDVMTGVDKLVKDGIADPERLGIMGWSYGGYLTAAAITKTNRFRAASIGAPATDWTTYYAQFDGSKEVLWTYFGGTPWEVPRNYDRHSVRPGIRSIRTPSLLQVGALDIDHNRELYQALTDLKVPVEYVVYPREGHGIVEREHQRDLMERNLRWFTRWVLDESAK